MNAEGGPYGIQNTLQAASYKGVEGIVEGIVNGDVTAPALAA